MCAFLSMLESLHGSPGSRTQGPDFSTFFQGPHAPPPFIGLVKFPRGSIHPGSALIQHSRKIHGPRAGLPHFHPTSLSCGLALGEHLSGSSTDIYTTLTRHSPVYSSPSHHVSSEAPSALLPPNPCSSHSAPELLLPTLPLVSSHGIMRLNAPSLGLSYISHHKALVLTEEPPPLHLGGLNKAPCWILCCGRGVVGIAPGISTLPKGQRVHTLPVPAQTCWTCLTSSGAARLCRHTPHRRWSGRRWHRCQPWAHSL